LQFSLQAASPEIFGCTLVAHRILNVGISPRPLYPPSHGKRTPVPIVKEAGSSTEPVWTLWRREKFLPHPCKESKPGRPARILVTILTDLLHRSLAIKRYLLQGEYRQRAWQLSNNGGIDRGRGRCLSVPE